MIPARIALRALLPALLLAAGCDVVAPQPPSAAPAAVSPGPSADADQSTDQATPQPPDTAGAGAPRPPLGTRRPPWLGQRVLPRTDSGFGEVRPTPPVLQRRRFPTIDLLPPPDGGQFAATIRRVPPAVAARSTWSPRCPVDLGDLRYVTVSFWGFDRRAHTGELLVAAEVADDVVSAFRQMFRARYPIEEMRVVGPPELGMPPTGDGNNTTAFVCRSTRGATSWSQHAYGLAIDVNPFFNPYVKGDVVLPELSSFFTDRDRRHPGLHRPGGPAVRAFERIGWTWGGSWSTVKDWMHFSSNGR